MNACRAVVIALLAGCYSPRAQEGAPCSSPDECPTDQHCVLGSCRLRDLPVDAAVPEIDAAVAIDARPDAMVLPCTATGVTCRATATAFSCGDHCWVYCPSATTQPDASQSCIGWQGALGQVDDVTEETCVRMQITAQSWIGLTQDDAATTPGMGWKWNGKTALVYTHWVSGKPDDGDGRENGAEQCGKMQPDGQWDDAGCTQANPFLCERP